MRKCNVKWIDIKIAYAQCIKIHEPCKAMLVMNVIFGKSAGAQLYGHSRQGGYGVCQEMLKGLETPTPPKRLSSPF